MIGVGEIAGERCLNRRSFHAESRGRVRKSGQVRARCDKLGTSASSSLRLARNSVCPLRNNVTIRIASHEICVKRGINCFQ
jgi:hypothetical protein